MVTNTLTLDTILPVSTLLFLTFLILFLQSFPFQPKDKATMTASRRLPPGPTPLPVAAGNLLTMLNHSPCFRWVLTVSEKNDITCIRLGGTDVIVVNCPVFAREFLKKHDATFASRPLTMATEYASRGYLSTALSPWGDQWKKMRRVIAKLVTICADSMLCQPVDTCVAGNWWQYSSNLASYEQLDAHEFFISMLVRIHEKEQSNFLHKGSGDCHCIAHSVFSGVLRSDVTCAVCGYTSTTYDPCVDLSLNLEPRKGMKAKDNSRISTLMGCLDLFTRPEKLGPDQKLYCQHCQLRQNSMKQMSIRRLPLVLCFHIKRFEHSLIRKTSKKIDEYLQFPFSLDMTPYLSSSNIRDRFGNRIFAFEGDELDISSDLCSEFDVFVVVTHIGTLESEHYVTYLRLRDHWNKCDDASITQVTERAVRASQVYMMYYVQKQQN
ncbi:ubiquitin C-terminal hydrolase 22-like [Typha angustifolia]|uniref:ubiquitin C-terminal hydrolase 22-like n=1 Tax=Typha angustifolia TaxID=59011 RepID=UPI003C2E1C48